MEQELKLWNKRSNPKKQKSDKNGKDALIDTDETLP